MRTSPPWRSALVAVAAFFLLGTAHSQSVGTIVQAQGDARLGGMPAKAGDAVQAGQPLTTGPDAHIYIKTLDGGFLILRPASVAQVIAYQVDAAQPANNRFKIELKRGVARSISGDAVKKSRENFRFNTPVAAIGVRGTDFTVFTDEQTTRVSVVSGGIVVSGFGAGCGPEGSGPCEGPAKRELYASPALQVLQVNRGQAMPQILRGNTLAPDASAPPRPDEPARTGAGLSASAPLMASASSPDLAPRKAVVIEAPPVVVAEPPPVIEPPAVVAEPPPVIEPPAVVAEPPPVVVAPPVVVVVAEPPPVIEPPVVVPPVAPVVALPALVWGRWQALADQPADTTLDALKADNQLIAINSYFALGRNKDTVWQAPSAGAVSFSLQSAQALVQADAGALSAASLENGRLNVNFTSSTFNTQFDLLALGQRLPMQAEGYVYKDGTFANVSQFVGANNMLVQGVMASDPVLQAAYLFQARIDASHVAYGTTQWSR